MARLPRRNVPAILQHLIQRGNNRQVCFGADRDFSAYAHWLKEGAEKYRVAIHAWVFMTNHVHLLVTPKTETGVSQLMQYLGRYYVQYFNHQYRRFGTLWEGRYKASPIQKDAYLLACLRYVELNPIKAKMVAALEDYPWSSYSERVGHKKRQLLDFDECYQGLGESYEQRIHHYQQYLGESAQENEIALIREGLQRNQLTGNPRFVDEIESRIGMRIEKRGRGRPRHEEK